MNRMYARSAAIVAALAMSPAFAAKDEEPTKEQPPPEVVSPETSTIGSVDAALRENFQEYVGLSLGKEGSVNLTLSKGANLEAVANLARETWIKAEGKKDPVNLPHFDFVNSAASPADLKSAHAMMRDVLALKGVVFLDLDEACGCISVGVADSSVTKDVTDYSDLRGIPRGWVKTVVTLPFVTTLNLRDAYRPTMGGIQIQWSPAPQFISSCSMGLPVVSAARSAAGFLTASHCTAGARGQMLGTEMFQNFFRSSAKIGDETIDTPLFTSATNADCPTGRRCRYSDAAFADFTRAQMGITGRIKRPTITCVGNVPCSLGVVRATDDIRVVGAISGLFMGDTVDKIGRTTGWTRGPISGTCVDITVNGTDAAGNVIDTGMTMLCQTIAVTASLPGDSGGPVFQFAPSTWSSEFAGILWGGPVDGSAMVFSPVDGIEKDLGMFIFRQAGVSAAFNQDGDFFTTDPSDMLNVMVERNVVRPDAVEFVLVAGPNVTTRKQLVLNEGAAAGSNSWTLEVDWLWRRSANGLFLNQLPGGILEFRKDLGNNNMVEVSRVPLDSIPGGTRLTFTWSAD